jgi:hypothetical protein
VVIVLPLLGAGLFWTKRAREGAILITISLLAARLYGLLTPCVLASPNYAMVAVTETMGIFMGAIAIRDAERTRKTSLVAS